MLAANWLGRCGLALRGLFKNRIGKTDGMAETLKYNTVFLEDKFTGGKRFLVGNWRILL